MSSFFLLLVINLLLFAISCLSVVQAFGYLPFDPFNARHGDAKNTQIGGTCREFLDLNGINTCCANREDDCYMLHYDTRCYCDSFCDRPQPDCCPDAHYVCYGQPLPTTTTTTHPPDLSSGRCVKDGVVYNDNDRVKDNCNECTCYGGQWECTNDRCLVDVSVLNEVNRGSSWIAHNYSNFWGKPLNYGFNRKLGTRLPLQKQKKYDPFAFDQTEISIPSEYDFRNDATVRNNLRRRPIRDQGECGASWAFSTIDVATDRFVKISKGKYGNQTDYSVQMLISCAILRDDQNGCTPSTTDIAWNFLNHLNHDAGVVEENCQPYTNGNKEYAEECQIPAGTKSVICPNRSVKNPYDASILLASPVYELLVESDEDIMKEILVNGPVQAIFKVYSDFFMYRQGVYQWSRLASEYDHRDPYHSVKLLGWGTENGVDYWLCANSWGEGWGEAGYFKIKRGEAEIGQHIFAAWGNGKVHGKLINNNKAQLNKLLQSRSQ